MKLKSYQNVNVEKSQSYLRWVMLFMLFFTQITNIGIFTGVSPIWSSVALYFNTNDYDMNWLINWYYFGPMIFAYILNPIILYNYGISQILSCSLTAIGFWILYCSFNNYLMAMLGFIFLGLGNSLVYQIPLQLSKLWFEPQERIVSTSIGQYSNNIGMLIGYLISSIYFYEIVVNYFKLKIDEQEFNSRFKNLLFFNAILSSICLLLSPINLITPINKHDEMTIRDDIWNSLKKAIKTGESFLDLVSLSTFIGLSWCYTMLFAIQQAQLGQTNLVIIISNVCFQIGSILAAIICTYQLNKQSKKGLQQNYDIYIKGTISLGFCTLVFEMFFLEFLSTNFTIFLNVFIGAGLGGTYSILLESLMEKHHPIQELAIGSLLSGIACTLAFIVTMILAIPEFLNYSFQISNFFLIPSYCYILVFYQTKYKRFEFES